MSAITLDERAAQRWVDAVAAFEVAQHAKGVMDSTIRQRLKHVRRFATHVGASPWHVTTEDIQGWLAGMDVAPATRLAHRTSLRAFYRWAFNSNRCNVDPTEEESHRATRLGVPELWAYPLAAYQRHLQARGLSPQTVRAWMEQLRTFARDNASLDPWSMTVDDLYEWQASKAWTRETRRGRKVMLRGFYRWAVDTGRIAIDPTMQLPRVKASTPVARPALDSEYEAALRKAERPWVRLAIRISAELGLRREETARIHSADIIRREDSGWWLVVHGKGGKTRVLPLPDDLSRALRVLPEGYVFPGQIVEKQRHQAIGHISARYLGKCVAEVLPEGITMHALRHRFATKVYNHSHDVFTLQKLLGHASAETTQRYVQVSDQRMRDLIETVMTRP